MIFNGANLMRSTTLFISAVAFVLSVHVAPAQRSGQTQTGSGGERSAAPNARGGINDGAQPGFSAIASGWFISGKVVVDDGSPLPEPASIERICGGVRRAEGYTDQKGRFSFQMGQDQNVSNDASLGGRDTGATAGMTSSSNSMNSTRMDNCEVRAVLPGYRSDMISLAGRRAMDNAEIGPIVLHKLANIAGSTISATSAEAPKDAKKAYEKGLEAVRKQKWDDAQKSFQKAIDTYPKYAAAWYGLGVAQKQQNNAEQARTALAKSIELDPKYVRPYVPLIELTMAQQKWQEAVDLSDKLIALDPVDYPNAHFYNAVANYSLQKLDAAEKSAREAVKLDTAHAFPRAEYVLGIILANKQDYSGALAMMKSYLLHEPDASDAPAIKQQITSLEQQAGQPK